MSIQSTVAKLLLKRDELNSFQCTEQLTRIRGRAAEINTRLEAICLEPAANGRLSPERQRISETGSPAELLALDQEEALLNAEADSLAAQSAALKTRLARAIVEEALPAAKAAAKALGPALKAAETAVAQAAKTKAVLEATVAGFKEARSTAQRGGLECPGISSDDFDRLAEVLGWKSQPPQPVFPENTANNLKRFRRELTEWIPEVAPEPLRPELLTEIARKGSLT